MGSIPIGVAGFIRRVVRFSSKATTEAETSPPRSISSGGSGSKTRDPLPEQGRPLMYPRVVAKLVCRATAWMTAPSSPRMALHVRLGERRSCEPDALATRVVGVERHPGKPGLPECSRRFSARSSSGGKPEDATGLGPPLLHRGEEWDERRLDRHVAGLLRFRRPDLPGLRLTAFVTEMNPAPGSRRSRGEPPAHQPSCRCRSRPRTGRGTSRTSLCSWLRYPPDAEPTAGYAIGA